MKPVVSSALTLLLVLLGAAAQQAATQAYSHHPEISSSLIVNQLAILNILEENSNSCSSTYPIIMDQLEAKSQEAKQDLDNLMTDVLAQISGIKNETDSAFENTKDEFKSLLEVYEESLTAYKAEVESITSSLNAMQDDLKNGLEAKLNEQQEMLTLQQEEINKSKTEVTSITTQVNSLKTNVDSISTKVNSLSTQVNSLSTQVGALNTQVNSLSTKVNSFTTQISSLTTKVNSISTKIDAFPTQIANLERTTKLNSLLSQHTVWHTSTLTCSGNQVLTSNSAAITVVNSGNYGDNVECSWKITLPAGKKILLKWSHFELEYNSECAYDYVMIQDLNRSSQLVYGSKLCGPIVPDNILVESNNLNIFFHSDRSNAFRGFGVVYQGI